jgi:hypothetical protein
VQICNANANRVTVSDKRQFLAVRPPSHKLALKHHVASLHVDLIKKSKGPWAVLHNIGYGIDCGPKIYIFLFSHWLFITPSEHTMLLITEVYLIQPR